MAGRLDDRFRHRLQTLVAAVAAHDSSAELRSLQATAQEAHANWEVARAQYDELAAQIGRSADEALERHRKVKEHLEQLRPARRQAEDEAKEAAIKAAEHRTEAQGLKQRLEEAVPIAGRTMTELRTLLAVPGVVEAVLGTEPAADDATLLAQVSDALAGQPTAVKRTLRERADHTRARLAGLWSIDPGVDHLVLRIGRGAAYAPARRWRDTNGRDGLPVTTLGRSLRVSARSITQLLACPPPTNVIDDSDTH